MWARAKIIRTIFNGLLVVMLGALVACDGRSKENTDLGAKICDIHRSVLAERLSPSETGIEINKKIEKEIPDYYNSYHVHIVAARPQDKYEVMKEAVKQSTGNDWKCGPVERFLGI